MCKPACAHGMCVEVIEHSVWLHQEKPIKGTGGSHHLQDTVGSLNRGRLGRVDTCIMRYSRPCCGPAGPLLQLWFCTVGSWVEVLITAITSGNEPVPSRQSLLFQVQPHPLTGLLSSWWGTEVCSGGLCSFWNPRWPWFRTVKYLWVFSTEAGWARSGSQTALSH